MIHTKFKVSEQITPMEIPIVIIRSHAHNYSETFIDDHIRYISNKTTVLYGWPFPRFTEGNQSVLSASLEMKLSKAIQARQPFSSELQNEYSLGLAQFLERSGARIALLESGLMGAVTSVACTLSGLRHVVCCLGIEVHDNGLLKQWQPHYQRFFQSASAVIGTSKEMIVQLAELGINLDRLELVHFGVSIDLEAYANPSKSAPVFLSVGRFVDKKAPHKTLQAFQAVYEKIPDARLIMVGDGPLLERCQSWVQEQGIDSAVTFTGARNRRSVHDLMSNARAFVQHSVISNSGDSEGTPVSIKEAGAHGLPIVSTRHAGIPEIVREETDGFLVDEGDIKGMAVAMYRLAKNPKLAAEMGSNFQMRVRSCYSRAVTIGRLQSLLVEVAESPLPPSNKKELKSLATQIKPEIANLNNAQYCLKLAERAVKLKDENTAFKFFNRALSLDRSCGSAYRELGIYFYKAGDHPKSYLFLKEAQRWGDLTQSTLVLLEELEAKPKVQTQEIKLYQERIQFSNQSLSKRPRRILIFTNLLPPQEMGGYGRSIWELSKSLILRGHTVSILTANAPYLEQKPYRNHQIVERHVDRELQLFGDWSKGYAKNINDVDEVKKIVLHNIKVILNQVRRFQPDVCMAGNLDFLGDILNPILSCGVPILHRLGNKSPSYPKQLTPSSNLYCLAGCSDWINQNLKKEGYQPKNFALVPPGSTLNEYYRFFLPNYQQLRICYAGLMMHYKGPHLILEALHFLKKSKVPFSCEFAGDFRDSNYEVFFKKLIKNYDLAKEVRLLGFCTNDKLRGMFDRSNVLIMPSIFEEPFGKVQIEAQSAGLAVVRSPVGGYKDMMQDGENGLLFKSEDSTDLARKLLVLLGNPVLWERLAQQGQTNAFQFTTQASVKKLENLFERLIHKRKAP